jgi:hypothetical protein
VRWTPLAALAALLGACALAPLASASPVLTLRDDGRVVAREDPYLPPAAPEPAPAPPRAAARAAAAAPRRTVRGELAAMLAAGLLDQGTHDAYRATYDAARATRAKLGGARRANLSAVLDTVEDVAAAGRFVPTRLPALFDTVAHNRQWWSEGPLLANGRRVTFQSSHLVWQYYRGQGLQIQWLGTFGRANGLWQSQTHDPELRALLDEALSRAVQRAGGIAFEYLFAFDGGRPPWVSGLAQGTAIQALARAAVRLATPAYFEAARAGLGVFRTAPPEGVRVATPAGAHYLIYSFAPRLRVLNAFTQALNGLHDFALLANDPEGRALFAAGDAQLRAELPGYDTGGWSRYSNFRDADVHYHRLARDFLRNLCARVQEDLARPTGGAVPGADPAPYCTAAQRFTGYLTARPRLALLSTRVRAGHPAPVRFTVDKPGFVSAELRRGGRAVAVLRGRVDSGRRSLRWARPGRPGRYAVILRATDLAGNAGAARGALRVLAPKAK